MRVTKSRANWIAVLGAGVVFLVMLVELKLRNWMPFVGGLFTYAALLMALWPRSASLENRARSSLPEAAQDAVNRLQAAADRLEAVSRNARHIDADLVRGVATRLLRLRQHHESNPDHVETTGPFVRVTLGHIVSAVGEYADLAGRLGPDQRERLGPVETELSGLLEPLERIEQACIDNDLAALEANMSALSSQLKSRH